MEDEFKRIADTATAEHYTWGDNCDGWHFVKSGNLSVIRETMPCGTSEVLHYHKEAQQFFYILSGNALFEIDGQSYTVGQNQGIVVKPGEKHKIINGAGIPLEFIVVSSPPSHGDRINTVEN